MITRRLNSRGHPCPVSSHLTAAAACFDEFELGCLAQGNEYVVSWIERQLGSHMNNSQGEGVSRTASLSRLYSLKIKIDDFRSLTC